MFDVTLGKDKELPTLSATIEHFINSSRATVRTHDMENWNSYSIVITERKEGKIIFSGTVKKTTFECKPDELPVAILTCEK